MKAIIFPELDIPDDLNNLEQFINHYDTVQEQIEFLKYVKLEMELYYETKIEDEFEAADVNKYDYWTKILDKRIKFYEGMLSNGSENNSQIKKSNVKNFNSREPEKVFQEYLERGTKYFLSHKHQRLGLLNFHMEMKKYFGDDIKLCEKVYYRIVNDTPIIRIFDFDIELLQKKLEDITDKNELLTEYEKEKNNIDNLLKAISDYKPEYYIKWEKIYNSEVDDDWLEEKGYIENSDSIFVDHYSGWLNYFLEDIENEKLKDILTYWFIGRMGDWDNINEKSVVKSYIDNLENELNSYQQKVLQTYLIVEKKLGLEDEGKSEKKTPKKKWKKNKSEFARFVNEEYERNNEDYKSLRDASNKLFDEYEFEDKNWTKEKCYDLVRQT